MKKRVITIPILLLWLVYSMTIHAQEQAGRIEPKLLKAVVRIKLPANEKGVRPTGTGFLVSRETNIKDNVIRRTFLVTNKHLFGDWNAADGDIINYSDGFDVYFYRTLATSGLYYKPLWIPLKNKDGKLKDTVKLHPNPIIDIAILALDEELSPQNAIDLYSFDVSYLLPFDKITVWFTGLGDQVFALGYPLGITSLKNGYPIAKSGYLASLPGEEFAASSPCINRKKETVIAQIEGKILVIDGLIVGGNSGGPVILPAETMTRRDPKTKQLQFSSEPTKNFVIGIVSGALGPSGVSIAYSSDYITELVELYLKEENAKQESSKS